MARKMAMIREPPLADMMRLEILRPRPVSVNVPTINPAAASSTATGSMFFAAFDDGLDDPAGGQPLVAVPAEKTGQDGGRESAERRILGRLVEHDQNCHQDPQGYQVIPLGLHDMPHRLGLGLRRGEVVLPGLHLHHEEGPQVVQKGRDQHHDHHVEERDVQKLHDEEGRRAHERRRDDGADAAGGDQAGGHVRRVARLFEDGPHDGRHRDGGGDPASPAGRPGAPW